MDDVLTLIQTAINKDEYGVEQKTLSGRFVYCTVYDITRAEFFNAGRNGLNPSTRFDVFHGDYNGENIVEYRGEKYAVYRTFRKTGSDYIELYVERQGGTNGQA